MNFTVWPGLVEGGPPAPRQSRFLRQREDASAPGRDALVTGGVSLSYGGGTSNHAQPPAPSFDTEDIKPYINNVQPSRNSQPAFISTQPGPSQPPITAVRPMTNHQPTFIPTQPSQSLNTPSAPSVPDSQPSRSLPSQIHHNVQMVNMNRKYPERAAHEYTILPTDDALTCSEKVARVDDLLSSGHTLAAQLGLLEGVPDRYTPDTLAQEGMKPEEKRAWMWWARAEASRPGSGSSQLPVLDIQHDRAEVPTVASGNKSNVAEKVPALELIYGLPSGTLNAEHVAYYLRPPNAIYFVSQQPSYLPFVLNH
jgi:hypothetical protein